MKIKSIRLLSIWIVMIASGLTLAAFTDWHTRPDKWKGPRIYHTPFEKAYLDKIEITKCDVPAKDVHKVESPNRAYWFSKNSQDFMKPGPYSTTVMVYNERDYCTTITLKNHKNGEPKVKWINQKLLYIEVWWGRILGTTLIYDVEKETMLHKEMVHDGGIDWLQWTQAQENDPNR